MKRYWFYGIMPKDVISEKDLSEKQKSVIKNEQEKLSQDNYQYGWLGFLRGSNWEFMRHGFETITIEEIKGNIARTKLTQILSDKYGEH